MAKKVVVTVRLQIPGGQATPSPPVGPALGQHGINIMEFCKAFNAKTKGQEGTIIPVVITIYSDRSFSFITKTPPAAVLIKQAVKIVKGSSNAKKEFVGSLTRKQLGEIAKKKWPDLTSATFKAAVKTIEGTAKSMGIEIVD